MKKSKNIPININITLKLLHKIFNINLKKPVV